MYGRNLDNRYLTSELRSSIAWEYIDEEGEAVWGKKVMKEIAEALRMLGDCIDGLTDEIHRKNIENYQYPGDELSCSDSDFWTCVLKTPLE